MAIRNVISTLNGQGEEIMGPNVLLYHHPGNDIMNGSLLTVESNHFCVLKSRGAILNVYDTGQYAVETPQKVLTGAIQQAFYGGQSPWQYEAIYINRSKLVIRAEGHALSREMAQLQYQVDYYIHVDSKEDALKLVQHMPYQGHFIKTDEVNTYAAPVLEQAINQICQVTPLEQINEKIHEITQLVTAHLQEFLTTYGITLNNVKVLVSPADDLMKKLISLRAFGLGEEQAVRYYLAMIMAERGLMTAPNMANGTGYSVQAVPVMSPPGLSGMSQPQPKAE